MSYESFLKDFWNSLYDPKSEVIDVINEFLHQDYEQCINGVKMNRNQYIKHVIAQRENITIDTIRYQHILERENELFALYYPEGKNIHNLPIQAEVIAYFLFQDKKLLKTHGQVRLIEGNLADVDMEIPVNQN